MLTKSLILGAASIVLSLPAFGGLLGSTADVAATLGFTPTVGDSPCRTASVVGAPVDASVEVGAAAYSPIVDCAGLVTADILDGSLVITGVRQFKEAEFVGDYAWLQLNFTFTGAPNILGVILDSQLLFESNQDNPAPSISFNANTITLTWDSSSSGPGFFELAHGGTAIFSITTEDVSGVPEPGTFALLGAGLLATAGVYRRRRA